MLFNTGEVYSYTDVSNRIKMADCDLLFFNDRSYAIANDWKHSQHWTFVVSGDSEWFHCVGHFDRSYSKEDN